MKRLEKLSKAELEDLVFDLVNALVMANSVSEAALFLQDLLTKKEISEKINIKLFCPLRWQRNNQRGWSYF